MQGGLPRALYLRATRDIKAHEQIFIHYGVNYWADDSFDLPLMIQAVERYINKVDLAHPVWYHLRLAPLLWHYLYGPSVPFPSQPSPVSTPEDPSPLVPPLPRLQRHRSLHALIAAMRSEGSLPPGEDLPSENSIANYCRRRGINNSKPVHHPDPVPRPPTAATTPTDRRRRRSELSPNEEPSSPPRKRAPKGLSTSDPYLPCKPVQGDALSSQSPSPTMPPTIGTSRRAVLLATDIAGVPSFPDMEGGLPAFTYRSPPASPVIDMSAYDLLLPVPVFPAPEIYSENSLPYLPLAAMPEDNPNPAALVRQPAPNRSAQPECILFPSFDKRVNNS